MASATKLKIIVWREIKPNLDLFEPNFLTLNSLMQKKNILIPLQNESANMMQL